MKKIITLCFLLTTSLALSDVVELRGGFDIASEFRDIDRDEETFGGEFGAEWRKEISDNGIIELGLGLAYQSHAEIEDDSNWFDDPSYYCDFYGCYYDYDYGKTVYDSIPIYGTIKVNIPIENSPVQPYVKGNIGYSFNVNEGSGLHADDGLYYAAGIGLNINEFIAEIAYQKNEADVSYNGIDFNGDYERGTLSFGYMFKY